MARDPRDAYTRIHIDVQRGGTGSRSSRASSDSDDDHFVRAIEAHLVDHQDHEALPDIDIVEDILRALRYELTGRLRAFAPGVYGNRSNAWILRHVQVRATLLTPDRREAVSDRWNPANEVIDIDVFAALWEKILQSRDDVNILDLVFGIQILESSVQRGHANARKDIRGVKTIKDTGDGLCLARSLFCALRIANDTRERAPRPAVIDAGGKALAEKVGFESPPALEAIGSRFLTHEDHRKFRVVVLGPHYREVPCDRVFTGESFHFSLSNLTRFSGRDYSPNLYTHNNIQRDRNTIWLYLDSAKGHYNWIDAPLTFLRASAGSVGGDNRSLCELCLKLYDNTRPHNCESGHDNPEPPTKRRRHNVSKVLQCPDPDCLARYSSRHPHKCGHTWCKTCDDNVPNNQFKTHRCYINRNGSARFTGIGDNPQVCFIFSFFIPRSPYLQVLDLDIAGTDDGVDDEEIVSSDLPEVWAWDIESMFVDSEFEVDQPFVVGTEEEGEPPERSARVLIRRRETVKLHKAVLIMAQNIRDPAQFHRFTTLQAFRDFFVQRSIELRVERGERRKVPIYLFAHNSSGYDSRMLFQACKGDKLVSAMFRGTKILRLQFGSLHFLDSMLHIMGSLRSIVSAFLPADEAVERQKGYFPYLFNTDVNQGYEGPIPDERHFDPNRMTPKVYAEFKRWYDAEVAKNEPYNLQREMDKYCEQDVRALAAVLLAYEKAHLSSHGISPLTRTTAASVAQHVYIQTAMPANTLCQLTYAETDFARSALRGGRTDVKRQHLLLTPDMIRDGHKIIYRDVCSLYPYVMLNSQFEYPVGPPTIFLFKTDPHSGADYWGPRLTAATFKGKPNPNHLKHRVMPYQDQWHDIHGKIMETFGIIEIDGYWSDEARARELHPVLPVFDLVDGTESKCLFTLDQIRRKVFCTGDVQQAIRDGFVVTRVYRYDQYARSNTLWRDYFRDFIKYKTIYSKPSLDSLPEDKRESTRIKYQTICDDYRDAYDILMDPDEFEDNPSKKQTFKILLNSLWGKFAQGTEHGKTHFFDMDKPSQSKQYYSLEDQARDGELTLSYGTYISDSLLMVDARPVSYISDYSDSLSRINVPAAAFVTMHGRLELHKKLQILGDRVLMHDTDSVIAHLRPGEDHLAPPHGYIVGEWEMEDEEAKNTIIEWVGVGPKSYAMRLQTPDGTIKEKIKCKGVTINRSTQHVMTFDALRDLVQGRLKEILIDTFRFSFHQSGVDMHTVNVVKRLTNLDDVYRKGVFGPDGFLYPYGHLTCGWDVKSVVRFLRARHSVAWQENLAQLYGTFEWLLGPPVSSRLRHILWRATGPTINHPQDNGSFDVPAIPERILRQALHVMNLKRTVITPTGTQNLWGDENDVHLL